MSKNSKKLHEALASNKFVLIDLDNCNRFHFNSFKEVSEEILHMLDEVDAAEVVVNFLNSRGDIFINAETPKNPETKDETGQENELLQKERRGRAEEAG